LPEVGVPVKGGEAVPQGCGAERSTLDGVTAGKKIALLMKRFDLVSQDDRL